MPAAQATFVLSVGGTGKMARQLLVPWIPFIIKDSVLSHKTLPLIMKGIQG